MDNAKSFVYWMQWFVLVLCQVTYYGIEYEGKDHDVTIIFLIQLWFSGLFCVLHLRDKHHG